MNVVVTGGAGYVGSVVVGKLLERGHAVRVVDECADGLGSLEAVLDRIELVRAEPRAMDPRWLEGVDGVIHLAGLSEWSTRGDDLEANWLANAVYTERLAMTCRAMEVPRLTYASTCDVYTHLPAGYEYDETAAVRPRSAFAASKFYGERRLQQLRDASFCPVILRHGTPYGRSPRTLFETTPNRFVVDAVSLGRVALPRDAWVARPLVAVDDLAEAHIACLEAPAAEVCGQVFNVVHANLRLSDVATTVAEVVGREAGYVRVTTTEGATGARDCRCSQAKLRERLGFVPRRTLETAVHDLAQHLTRHAPISGRTGTSAAWSRGSASPMFCVPGWLLDERVSGSYRCWCGEAGE